jgi:hypothetical protein
MTGAALRIVSLLCSAAAATLSRGRSYDAVVCVHDAGSKMIERHEHNGDLRSFPDGLAGVCRLGLLAVSEFSYVK